MQERSGDLPVEEWDISRIRSNPLQQSYFRWRSRPEMDAFIADMRDNGQREPVEVLPDGVLLAGHHRLKAARRLRWKTIKVVVRHDLAEQGAEACEAYFLSSNRTHRRLKPLEKARMFERLRQLGRGDHCEQLAKELDLSLRQLRRLCQLLRAPVEVQNAIDDKKLSQKAGRRVAEAQPGQQQRIAELIRDGRPPELAVRTVLGFSDREKPSGAKLERLWREFLAKGRDLKDLGPDAFAGLMPAHGPKLAQVMEWMARLALRGLAKQVAAAIGPISFTIIEERD